MAKITKPDDFTYVQSNNVTKAENKLNKIESKNPGAYKESSTVKALRKKLNATESLNPGEYTSKYTQPLQSALGDILNRKAFSYDISSDAIYNLYKDLYTAQGKSAMEDTVGQAAAMTGGYSNSYAVTAGNQAYQKYLDQLSGKIPELYQLALSRYNQEGQDALNKYSVLSDAENTDYSRYNDQYNRFLNEREYASSSLNNERSFDFGKWEANVNKWQNDRSYYAGQLSDLRNFDYGSQRDTYTDSYNTWRDLTADNQFERQLAYQKRRDEIADKQWQQTYDYNQKRDEIADQQWQQTFDLQKNNASKSSGSTTKKTDYSFGTQTSAYKTAKNSFKEWAKDGNKTAAQTYVNKLVSEGYDLENVMDLYYSYFEPEEEKKTVSAKPGATITANSPYMNNVYNRTLY